MTKSLFLLSSFISLTSLPLAAWANRTLASIKEEIRVVHAKELMGIYYKKSFLPQVEQKKNLEKNILTTVTKLLPKAHQGQAYVITNTIIQESQRHGLDPYFIMAVISGESSFNPRARGPVGEIGLMQIRPSTGEWLAEKIKLPWKGPHMLENPVLNIKLGTSYLAWLREKFSGNGQLYLAAYNMGARKVRNAVEKNVMPKDYPRHVMKRYIAFYKELNASLSY